MTNVAHKTEAFPHNLTIPFTYSRGIPAGKGREEHVETIEITLGEFIDLVREPNARERKEGPYIVPGLFSDGHRCKASLIDGLQYLTLDLDEGFIEERIRAKLGKIAAIVWTTYSSTPDNPRWRVIIPLQKQLTIEEWGLAARWLWKLFEEPDACSLRPVQRSYLPACPSARRDAFRFFETVTDGPLWDPSDAIEEMREADRQMKSQLAQERERLRKNTPPWCGNDSKSVIGAFNASTPLQDMLLRCGYQCADTQGLRWLSPNSESGLTGVEVKEDGHWVSYHDSDRQVGVGRVQDVGAACACYGDAFDLFKHYEHRGDERAAVRAAAERLGMEKHSNGHLPPIEIYENEEQRMAEEAISAEFPNVSRLPSNWHGTDPPQAEEEAGRERRLILRSLQGGSVAEWFNGASIKNPPELRWLFENVIPEKAVSVFGGAGGTGKGHCLVGVSISCATGHPFGPFTPVESLPVLYIGKEDDREEQWRRVFAAKNAWDQAGNKFLPPEIDRLKENLFIPELPATVTLGQPLVDALGELAQEFKPGLLILDPLGRFWEPNAPPMNSQEGAAWAHNWLGAIQTATGATVITAVHVHKRADPEKMNASDITGSAQLVDFARCAIQLGRLTQSTAQAMGLRLPGHYIQGIVTKRNRGRWQDEPWLFEQVEGGALVPCEMPSLLLSDMLKIEEIIQAAMPQGIPDSKLKQIVEEDGFTRNRIRDAKRALKTEKRIRQIGARTRGALRWVLGPEAIHPTGVWGDDPGEEI